ncbi:MFS transporter [Myceligenerans crystallogenes]
MQARTPLQRARTATLIAFATNGAMPATLLARYAEVKDLLGLDTAAFGLLVVGSVLGAVGSLHLPGAILRRIGSRWTASAGTAWAAAALVLAATGVAWGNPWVFLAGIVLGGFADAVVDVAQNAHGLRVQEAYGRSLLSSMHAGWSIGAAIGGLAGTAAASAGVPLPVHLGAWGLLCTVVMAWSCRAFLPDARGGAGGEQGHGRLGWRAAWLLAPLALVALAGFAVEDIGNNWSAVLLATERGVPVANAGIGLSVLLGAQFAGRLLGDRFIDRVGNRPALVTSLGLVAVGLLISAWAPGPVPTLAGLALAGLGCAITVPLAFAGADAVRGLRPHDGVTWIGWVMRAASIGLSPAIGAVAMVASLPLALSLVSLLAILALAVQARAPR